jgi:hypothetical protein
MFGNRTLAGFLEEFAAVRQAKLLLLRSLDAEACGVASEKEISVRELADITAGHLHHRSVIRQGYLTGAESAASRGAQS